MTYIMYCRQAVHRYTGQPMLVPVTAWPHCWGMGVTWQLGPAPTYLLWMLYSLTSHVHCTSSRIFWMGALSLMVLLLMIVISRYVILSSYLFKQTFFI